jgi:hypothetical protein
MHNFAAAGAKSYCGNYSRDDDHAFHGLLSYDVFGNRIYSLPVCNAQIKNAAHDLRVFHHG